MSEAKPAAAERYEAAIIRARRRRMEEGYRGGWELYDKAEMVAEIEAAVADERARCAACVGAELKAMPWDGEIWIARRILDAIERGEG